ncbi:MAG: transglycosylase domain-containing protein [Leptothrix sp. (in: b-proteobacteria)]
MKPWIGHATRLLTLVVLCFVALQLYFLGRIALMNVLDVQSTSFQRSEAWRLLTEQQHSSWSQDWRSYAQINDSLKRAVIASEDAGFTDHNGVEWDALEKAWERNQKAEATAAKLNEAADKRAKQLAARRKEPPPPPKKVEAKVVGGSTISQQLAKNLFLSSERTALRKGQEFLITFMLEAALPKQRILELYLNNVEWGEGLFGAQAAARYYFGIDAARLSAAQAARLAVMLPAPKRFEKRPTSPYLLSHAGTVAARMGAVDLP